ncbi:MAG: carbohydrate kinase family protein [Bacteroidetes bacterium]|nr:carbohydrate kinase family protein [Bacteroidota bacterium]
MKKPVVCIGASLLDETFFCMEEPLQGTSNPAAFKRSAGGVARNIAHHLAQLGNSVELISHFGNDLEGKWLMEKCSAAGTGLSHSLINEAGTGRFTAIVAPGGELFTGAAFTHFEKEVTVRFLEEKNSLLKSASLIQFDCNISSECLEWLLDFCRSHSIPCVIEPVSVAKAKRLKHVNLENVLLITPNIAELAVLFDHATGENSAAAIQSLLKKGVQNIWMRKGDKGSELFTSETTIHLPAPVTHVVDTTGAGDAALAGWMHAWLQNKNAKECLRYGHAMAEIILQIKGANSDELNHDMLEKKVSEQKEK